MKKSFQRVIATLNLFQGKQSLTVFLLAAIFALSACDDSSSASSNEPDENAAVDSSSSVCKDCEDGDGSSSSKKVESSDSQSRDSSSDEKSNSSSSKKGNATNSSSSVKGNSNSSASILDGDCQDGDTRTNLVSNAVMFYYHCESGEWIRDSLVSLIDTSENVISRPKLNLDSVFNPDVDYGEFKDERDGHVYKTITFVDGGNTRTMFAQNLNYGTFVKLGEESDAEVQKHCYDDDEWYCDHFFGGLYTWSEAFGLPRTCDTVPTGNSAECPDTIWTTAQLNNGWQTIKRSLWKGLCPKGWHILTENEWVTAGVQQITGSLVDDLSKSTWWYEKSANNKTGTSLLAVGYAEDDPIKQRGDSSVYLHERTAFWLSSDVYGIDSIGGNVAMSMLITSHHLVNKASVTENRFRKTAALSIRCITD